MFPLSRREFLKGSALLATAAASARLMPQATEASPLQNQGNGANDRLNVAVIGVKGRGRDHISGLADRHNCHVTHICDVDSAVVGPAVTLVRSRQGYDPTIVTDMRQIFENKNIHLVTVATPNHWHTLAAIWAMQAGKHVYVEKPVSHNVWEGRRLVEIARQTNKICQAGTQIRSNPGIRQAIQYLRNGELGQVRVGRGLCYKTRNSIGLTAGPQAVPGTCNYNLWCGPAPNTPPRRQNFHYDWHWFWDYGNGDLGNQGIHQMDVARWGLGKTNLANSVVSVGGRFGYTDDGQTANTQIALFNYGNCDLMFEVRGLTTAPYRGARVGNVFHCANGYLVMPSYNVAIAYNPDGSEIRRWGGDGDHYGNFVQAVRNNRRQDLNGEVEEGHISSALCHLANISYQLAQPAPFYPRSQNFTASETGTDTLARMEQHLRNNNMLLQNTMLKVGPLLQFDPQQERFTSHPSANALLTRQYRAGFVVPGANT